MTRASLVAGLLVAACHAPPSAQHDAAAGVPTACTQIGASCMFAPGKLGTCVEAEPTSGPATLVCQSQH